MELFISNINPPDNQFPFITANIRIQDEEIVGQSIFFQAVIDKQDASLSEIKELSIEKLKDFLNRLSEEIDNL
jgi:hypothetical protein